MSKRFLTDVIARAAGMPANAAGRLAGEILAAVKAEIVQTGRYSLPGFGSFAVRETPRRTALNPRTGEKVDVKAGAAVRFRASPSLKEAAFAGLRKARRKTAKKT
jgi:DNA-binding protein HU-beta